MFNSKAKLNQDKANEILNNVFDSCNIPPSSKSFEEIMAENYRKRIPLAVYKFIATLFMFAAVLVPFLFKPDPNFRLTAYDKNVVVTSHNLYDSCFIMTLTGSADYDNIYAKKNNGAIIFPEKADESAGLVIFPYDGDDLNIYIHTNNGGCIQAVLAEKK